MDQTLKRIAPLTGVGFVVLYVAGALLAFGDAPSLADEDVQEIVAYYGGGKPPMSPSGTGPRREWRSCSVWVARSPGKVRRCER
jgi:hypothetical protein